MFLICRHSQKASFHSRLSQKPFILFFLPSRENVFTHRHSQKTSFHSRHSQTYFFLPQKSFFLPLGETAVHILERPPLFFGFFLSRGFFCSFHFFRRILSPVHILEEECFHQYTFSKGSLFILSGVFFFCFSFFLSAFAAFVGNCFHLKTSWKASSSFSKTFLSFFLSFFFLVSFCLCCLCGQLLSPEDFVEGLLSFLKGSPFILSFFFFLVFFCLCCLCGQLRAPEDIRERPPPHSQKHFFLSFFFPS